MRKVILFLFISIVHIICYAQASNNNDVVIGKGKMPNIARDKFNNIHLVYGTGDSIMYASSGDAKSFTAPSLVAVLPKLFASAMRGPQIAAGTNGVVVTACDSKGNIYSYAKESSGGWSMALKVNETDEVAKEALMALGSDGLNAYAVWLGVKGTKGQNVYGARSVDGGRSWSKNMLVYASPDSSVCECCKPSVAIAGNNVYVMFRNWLNESRDLYIIKSTDGGKSFGQAQKLGNGSWKLNGCPMDGGGLVINKNGVPETVWRREGKIYSSAPGEAESAIGEGRSCSIESVNNKNFYAWTIGGNVVVQSPGNKTINLGKGTVPLIKAVNDTRLLCVWENENKIHAYVLAL